MAAHFGFYVKWKETVEVCGVCCQMTFQTVEHKQRAVSLVYKAIFWPTGRSRADILCELKQEVKEQGRSSPGAAQLAISASLLYKLNS